MDNSDIIQNKGSAEDQRLCFFPASHTLIIPDDQVIAC